MVCKRLFDLCLTVPGVVALLPVFIVIAGWIRLDSPGPVFFRQERVGQGGRLFRIFKFRTMVVDAEARGRQITVEGDNRITNSGRFLRRYKLDELPQLFNVVLGDMSLVGPRPEVPRYMAEYPGEIRDKVLSVPPGITDFAAIEFIDENQLLAKADNPERAYIEEVLPIKQSYYLRYVEERSLILDLKLILRTIKAIVS